MAKKSDSEISKSRNMRELDDALQKSFVNIKNDMTALREGMHQQGVKLAEVKQEFKDSKADHVTVDKFNILKIKIGELNESMKKVWDIEKKLEDLDRKSVSAAEFDKHTVGVDNELAKLREDVKDLDKTATTEEQTKNLVMDINKEFDGVKKAIEELRSIKDAITRAELDKRTDALNKKAQEVRKDFDKVKAEVKSKVTAAQVEDLVSDINKEFDKIKVMISDVKEGEDRFALDSDVEKKIAKVEKKVDLMIDNTTVAIDEFTKGMESAFKDLAKSNEKRQDALAKDIDKSENKLNTKLDKTKESLTADVSEIRKDMKNLVSKKQAENLVKDINKEFDSVKDDVDDNTKMLAAVKKDSATKKEVAAEIAKLKKGVDSMSKELAQLKKDAAMDEDVNGMFAELKDGLKDMGVAVKEKFNELTGRLKKESDETRKSIKSNSQDINSFEKEVKKELKTRVDEDDLHDELDVVRGEFEKLHKELKAIKANMLEEDDLKDVNKKLAQHVKDVKSGYVDAKKFNKLVDAVEKLQDQVEDQGEMLKEKRHELKAYAKELKAAKKINKKLARYEPVVASASSKKAKKSAPKSKSAGEPYRKSAFLGSFLIGAAFVLLIAAVVLFFTGLTGLTDILAIAAVVCFVLGIIIRIVVGVKRNGN